MKCSGLVLGFVLLVFIVILVGYFDARLNVCTPLIACKERHAVFNA